MDIMKRYEIEPGNRKRKKIRYNWISLNSSILFLFFFTYTALGQNVTDSITNSKESNIKEIKTNPIDTSIEHVKFDKMFTNIDTANQNENLKNPRRAGILSAICPGLGQAYNGKYWKIPVIYSILATMCFVIDNNQNSYMIFKNAYAGDTIPGINLKNYSRDQIKQKKDYYRRNRDLSIIVTFALYLMNILDASTDANLMNFDISEDLSLKIQPDYYNFYGYQKTQKNSSFGLKFVLSF
jgi:hypothetical protein